MNNMGSEPYLDGLGRRQKALLNKMLEGWYVSIYHNKAKRGDKIEILTDGDDEIFLEKKSFSGLLYRDIIMQTDIKSTPQIESSRYVIKSEYVDKVKEFLG